VKDIMNAVLRRQRQFVCNRANTSQHLKRPVELGCELHQSFICQYSGQMMMKAQPYPSLPPQILAPDGASLKVNMVLIIVSFHQVLGMLQPIFNLN
jgi:hypothetical protein